MRDVAAHEICRTSYSSDGGQATPVALAPHQQPPACSVWRHQCCNACCILQVLMWLLRAKGVGRSGVTSALYQAGLHPRQLPGRQYNHTVQPLVPALQLCLAYGAQPVACHSRAPPLARGTTGVRGADTRQACTPVLLKKMLAAAEAVAVTVALLPWQTMAEAWAEASAGAGAAVRSGSRPSSWLSTY